MDYQALEQLYHRWAPLIYRRCLKLLGNEEEARDALQEVFLRVLERLDAYEAGERTFNLLYTVATRHCLNRLRDRKPTVDGDVLEWKVEPGSPVLDEEDLMTLFRTVVFEADERTAMVGVLYFLDECSQDEVARTLGINRRTVKKHLDKLVARVRRKLSN